MGITVLSIIGQSKTNQTALDHGISDMVVVTTTSGPVLYTSSGADGGVVAYALSESGDLTAVDTSLFPNNWASDAIPNIGLIQSGATPQLVVAIEEDGDVVSLALEADGQIGEPVVTTGVTGDPAGIFDLHQTDGPLLFAGYAGETAIQGYTLSADGDLVPTFSLTDTATTYGRDVFALGSLSIGGNDYLIGASATERGVTAYRYTQNGAVATGSMGAMEGLGVMTPTAMETVQINDRSFVLLASAPGGGMGMSGAISVMELTADGALTAVDHVLDTLTTRFGGIKSLDVTEAEGRTYVTAAGSDGGATVFALLPNGRLHMLDVIEDQPDIGLENVSAIASATDNGTLNLFFTSEVSAGVAHLTMDVSQHGIDYLADAAGGSMTGTGLNDIMIGGDGNDVLNGGAGDDILEDGSGGDRLTGGAGRDVFMFRFDQSNDVVFDFNADEDRLDLSDWPFLYDMSQLAITPTDTGAIITWRGEFLELRSQNGETLDKAQVLNAIITAPNRLPTNAETGASANDRFLDGTTAPDALTGGSGQDTIYGYTGHDMLAGDAGDDQITAGSGSDTVTGGAGDDQIWGQLGNDSLTGDDGLDTLDGGAGDDYLTGGTHTDSLLGGVGNDTLIGGADDDHLFGHAGADLLDGGDGSDRLWAGTGDDTIMAGDGDDSLFAQHGDDILEGDDGADHLDGGTGHDTMDGGAGADNLYGQDGNDSMFGGAGFDKLYGGSGHDVMDGGDGIDALYGELGNDTLYGGMGPDELDGGPGHDHLFGKSGHDALFGGAGNDILDGGMANDSLSGNAGADIFVFADGHGEDSIHDFETDVDLERIDLSGVTALDDITDITGPGGAAEQIGDDIKIDTGNGNAIWLMDADIGQLGIDDFLF
ncbi:MAG: calcium-binding protein [Pseudomonadota bacterium]